MYFLIGISFFFALLFAVNFTASVVTTAVWSVLARFDFGGSARKRSSVIFALRVVPLAAAALFIFAFILPAYLIYEPAASGETVGYKLAVIALISAAGLIAATCRIFASWWRTRRLVAGWMTCSEVVSIGGANIPTFRLRHAFPVIAVVGVFRPRMFVAEQILTELSEEELTAAIDHEMGHIGNRDNFKRFAMRLCADLLILPLGKTLDRVWSDAAETAADEYAASRGGAVSALNLASALIKIGRIAPVEGNWALPSASYLIERQDAALAMRIGRLLELADRPERMDDQRSIRVGRTLLLALAVTVAIALPLAVRSDVLASIHSMSEAFLALLQ